MNTSVIDTSKVRAPRQEVATVADAGSLIHAIATAARDPSTDMDKMERLFVMHQKMVAQEAEKLFNASMSAAQAEMGRVATDADNDHTHSRYASYGQIDKALRPIYTKHGFALSFDEIDSPKPLHVRILCYVSHRDGHTRTYRIDMPTDGKGPRGNDVMTPTHASGSAHSYGRRYLVKDIFNVAIGEDDNDGNGPPVSPEQVTRLRELLKDANVNEGDFLNSWKLSALTELPAFNFDFMVDILEKRKKKVDPRGDTSQIPNALRDKHVSAITDLSNEFGSDEPVMERKFREYVDEFLRPFPELWITVNDKLAADKVLNKATMRKWGSLSLQGTNNREQRW